MYLTNLPFSSGILVAEPVGLPLPTRKNASENYKKNTNFTKKLFPLKVPEVNPVIEKLVASQGDL